MTSRNVKIVLALLALAAALSGCGQKEEFGDKKEDWSKAPPPAGWKGPGQAGGPSDGAITGPPPGK